MMRRRPAVPVVLPVALAPLPEAVAVVCEEFLLTHPAGRLRRETVLAASGLAVVAASDWLCVFHVMQLKAVDAMGNAIGSMAGLVATCSVTVMGYVACGVALARPERWGRVAACVFYLVVLTLLFQALAPAEAPNIRAVWDSLTGGGGFGASGGAQEAPALFVFACVSVLAVAFSLFGVVLIAAERRLGRLAEMWRQRGVALAVLLQRERDLARTQALGERAAFLATLDTAEVAETIVVTVLRRGLAAYSAALATHISALQSELSDLRHSYAERQRLSEQLAAAQACLASATTITEESL